MIDNEAIIAKLDSIVDEYHRLVAMLEAEEPDTAIDKLNNFYIDAMHSILSTHYICSSTRI